MLPDDLQPIEALARELEATPEPSVHLDQRLQTALFGAGPPQGLYTRVLDEALLLIPRGWWWHMSHLEVAVIPTNSEPGLPLTNATDYDIEGRPFRFMHSTWGDHQRLAFGVCIAVLRACLAQRVKVRAVADQRMYMVQTGDGPRLVDVDGRLKHVPQGAWLDDAGMLIAHKSVFPQYTFREPDPEPDDDDETAP